MPFLVSLTTRYVQAGTPLSCFSLANTNAHGRVKQLAIGSFPAASLTTRTTHLLTMIRHFTAPAPGFPFVSAHRAWANLMFVLGSQLRPKLGIRGTVEHENGHLFIGIVLGHRRKPRLCRCRSGSLDLLGSSPFWQEPAMQCETHLKAGGN
jgi:hypothetical protein